MKLRINGDTYDYGLALQKVSIGDMLRLQQAGGPSRRAIQLAWDVIDRHQEAVQDAVSAVAQAGTDTAETASKALQEAETAAGEALDSPDVLVGMAGTVYLCKAHAGEPVTWEEAQGYSWPGDVHFVPDAADMPETVPDPQEAPGEAPPPGADCENGLPSQQKTGEHSTSMTSNGPSTS